LSWQEDITLRHLAHHNVGAALSLEVDTSVLHVVHTYNSNYVAGRTGSRWVSSPKKLEASQQKYSAFASKRLFAFYSGISDFPQMLDGSHFFFYYFHLFSKNNCETKSLYDTFVKIGKHPFVMHPLQNPQLCSSTAILP
jgi:hypothetical protein